LEGHVNGTVTTFSGDSLTSIFEQADYSVAPPPPSPSPFPSVSPLPSPSLSPLPSPSPVAVYIFTGTYHVKSTKAATDGCFTLITTQNGSPLPGALDAGLGIGIPQFNVLTQTKNVTTGTVPSSSITLTTSGGSGTFTLSNGHSGTVTLTTRASSTFDRTHRKPVIYRH